jgi:hypothetical protein
MTYSGLLIELPQPGKGVPEPMTAKLTANASVTLVKKAAKDDPITRNGVSMQEHKLMHNLFEVLIAEALHSQGRGFFDLVRTHTQGNPWRIRAFRAEPSWYSGNWDVFSP